MIGIASVPAALLLILMLRAPESPRWLVKVDKVDDARNNLRRVRGEGDVEAELGEIVAVEEEERRAPISGWKGLSQP